jgi:hypothetical protein
MSEVLATTPVSELSDLEVIKEILHYRGPYGEAVPWRTPTERLFIESRSVELHRELKDRKITLPSQQSIGRSKGTALTPEELEIWHQLVAEWDGVSAAPRGEDVRLDLQET